MVLFAKSDNLKACAHFPNLLRYWESTDLKHKPGREEEKEHFCHSFENQDCYQVNLISFPGDSDGKASAYDARDLGSIPGSERSPGEGNGNPLQYSWASLVAQRLKHLPALWETWVQSLGQEYSTGDRNGNPLQYFCLENPMDGGSWWATVHGDTKSRTQLSDLTFLSF